MGGGAKGVALPDRPIGIVIPTLNEATALPGLLEDLAKLPVPTDIVVADGGSVDDTVSVAQRAGGRVVSAPRGRGPQLNAGAAVADGEWLCFLHADVRMPEGARDALIRVLQSDAEAAVWGLAIAATGVWPRVMEFGARIRDRLGGLPYGDQGLLVRRTVFETVGGYREIPIMEDVAMVRALSRRTQLERMRAPLLVSPRRWERQGPCRTWIRNSLLITAYHAGVSPVRLARWYRPELP
jgi:rSAM/selenodomain-associated transferase 2